MDNRTKHAHAGNHNTEEVLVNLFEDDSSLVINVPDNASGKWLLESVCRRIGVLQEREYFGLRFLDHERLSKPTKQWINLSRPVLKQLHHTNPLMVNFRFKHYPSNPVSDLKLSKTAFLLYDQLRRDLQGGRLVPAVDQLVYLGALVVQVELGDASMQVSPQLSAKNQVTRHYLSSSHFLHNQGSQLSEMLLDEHKKLEGWLPAEAAAELIEQASHLDSYGIDPVRVTTKSYKSRPIHLGITNRGIAEFFSSRRQKEYAWSSISSMAYDGKNFVITVLQPPSRSKKKRTSQTISYKCDNKGTSRALWEWATDRKLFLTLDKSSKAKPIKSKRNLFSRSHTFRFSGRCRQEVLSRPSTLPRTSRYSLAETTDSLAMDASSIPPHINETFDCCSQSMVALNVDTSVTNHNTQQIHSGLTPLIESEQPMERFDVSPSRISRGGGRGEKGEEQRLAVSTATSDFQLNESVKGLSFNGDEPTNEDSYIPKSLVLKSWLVPHFNNEQSMHRFSNRAEVRQKLLMDDYIRQSASQTSDALKITEPSFDEQSLKHDEASLMNRSQSVPREIASTTSADLDSTCVPQSSSANSIVRRSSRTVSQSSSGRWSVWAASLSLITGLSVFGLAILLEVDTRSPVFDSLRSHNWLLGFDQYYNQNRPLTSAFGRIWRRN